MINNAVLVGRLTKDPDVRQTQNGTLVASFTLAVERPFKDKNTGQRDADFIQIVAWRKTAEIIQQYTYKGALIGVQGRIQTRNYDDKDGKRVYVTEVIAEQINLLTPKQNTAQNQNNGGYQANNYQTNTNTYNTNSKPPIEQNMPNNKVVISDDDLPF